MSDAQMEFSRRASHRHRGLTAKTAPGVFYRNYRPLAGRRSFVSSCSHLEAQFPRLVSFPPFLMHTRS